jgi:hypothetical protein
MVHAKVSQPPPAATSASYHVKSTHTQQSSSTVAGRSTHACCSDDIAGHARRDQQAAAAAAVGGANERSPAPLMEQNTDPLLLVVQVRRDCAAQLGLASRVAGDKESCARWRGQSEFNNGVIRRACLAGHVLTAQIMMLWYIRMSERVQHQLGGCAPPRRSCVAAVAAAAAAVRMRPCVACCVALGC